jgi:hypothetical protein
MVREVAESGDSTARQESETAAAAAKSEDDK